MPGMTLVGGENTNLEYSNDGGATYYSLPYVGDISVSGGEAPETDIIAFRRTGKLAGKVRVPSFTMAIPSYTPQLQAFKDIRKSIDDGDTLNWRLTTRKDTIFTNADAADTVAIETTGIVTFAGDAPDFAGSMFGEGMAIKVGGENYVIDSISDATPPVVMVRPVPGAAVAAAQPFMIDTPSLRLGPFTAKVRSPLGFDLPAEGNMTSSIDLTPEAQLPDWTIV